MSGIKKKNQITRLKVKHGDGSILLYNWKKNINGDKYRNFVLNFRASASKLEVKKNF